MVPLGVSESLWSQNFFMHQRGCNRAILRVDLQGKTDTRCGLCQFNLLFKCHYSLYGKTVIFNKKD